MSLVQSKREACHDDLLLLAKRPHIGFPPTKVREPVAVIAERVLRTCGLQAAMNLRVSLPRVRGRGAGLGNELIPWARSYLAAQVLGAKSLPPAFGLNRRRYWRHFGTPRYDWLLHRAAETALPVVEFRESDYDRHGGADVVGVIRQYAAEHNLFERKRYALVTEGMWGGFLHITAAREFVRSTLYRSRFAAKNLLRLHEQLDPTKLLVAMHVRLGDFNQDVIADEDYRGAFNRSLPFEWYLGIAHSLRTQLGEKIQFLIVSDGHRDQLELLQNDLPPDTVTTLDMQDADCSDLLALASADLLVCSISSYSLWAAFISDRPYLWFEPHLHHHDDEELLSIWGHEPKQQTRSSPTQEAVRRERDPKLVRLGRGVPVPRCGAVPNDVVAMIEHHHAVRSSSRDLIRYGVVAASRSEAVEVGR